MLNTALEDRVGSPGFIADISSARRLCTDEHWSSAHKAKNQIARKSCLQKAQILEQGVHKSLFISVHIQHAE